MPVLPLLITITEFCGLPLLALIIESVSGTVHALFVLNKMMVFSGFSTQPLLILCFLSFRLPVSH